jgi:hypothetical protein
MAKKTKQSAVKNGLKEQAVETVETQSQVEEVAAEQVVSEDKYPGNATRAFRG